MLDHLLYKKAMSNSSVQRGEFKAARMWGVGEGRKLGNEGRTRV